MNREILFRGKNEKIKKWIYGSLLEFLNGDCYICKFPDFFDVDKTDALDMYAVNPETIGQYTGVKDMFGEKVFEGDYIYCDADEEIGIVKFDEGEFVCVYGDVIDENRFADIIVCSHVIGNIHDNPGLVGDTENEIN